MICATYNNNNRREDAANVLEYAVPGASDATYLRVQEGHP